MRPLDPVPGAPAKSADLFAGRNEFEPFQIVLRAEGKDLADVDIDVSDLQGTDGASIPAGKCLRLS